MITAHRGAGVGTAASARSPGISEKLGVRRPRGQRAPQRPPSTGRGPLHPRTRRRRAGRSPGVAPNSETAGRRGQAWRTTSSASSASSASVTRPGIRSATERGTVELLTVRCVADRRPRGCRAPAKHPQEPGSACSRGMCHQQSLRASLEVSRSGAVRRADSPVRVDIPTRLRHTHYRGRRPTRRAQPSGRGRDAAARRRHDSARRPTRLPTRGRGTADALTRECDGGTCHEPAHRAARIRADRVRRPDMQSLIAPYQENSLSRAGKTPRITLNPSVTGRS